MNHFIIVLPLSATPSASTIVMLVVMIVILVVYSNFQKRKLSDALKWRIETADEVVTFLITQLSILH